MESGFEAIYTAGVNIYKNRSTVPEYIQFFLHIIIESMLRNINMLTTAFIPYFFCLKFAFFAVVS